MAKKVLKFGGTSVGTFERSLHVAKIIKKEHDASNEIIAVVSAMSGKTNELLKEVGIPYGKINITLSSQSPPCLTKHGIDHIQILFSPDNGNKFLPISKIASGGELSRIMLAIKTVLTSLDTVEILIFDEIDTGISGAIAEIVGKKLNALGKRHQTLCVTHLAQIAAYADHHYLDSKYQNTKGCVEYQAYAFRIKYHTIKKTTKDTSY